MSENRLSLFMAIVVIRGFTFQVLNQLSPNTYTLNPQPKPVLHRKGPKANNHVLELRIVVL